MMGCGASKSIAADPAEGNEPLSCSVTQIRDIAPAEVADTGAHPPALDDSIQHVYFQREDDGLELPGVIPDSSEDSGADSKVSSSKTSASLIKMHPPRRQQFLLQRLDEEQTGDLSPKIASSEIQVLE